jgi:hypothetical protein
VNAPAAEEEEELFTLWEVLGLEAPGEEDMIEHSSLDLDTGRVVDALFYGLADPANPNPLGGYMWQLEADATVFSMAVASIRASMPLPVTVINRLNRASRGIARRARLAAVLFNFLDDGGFAGELSEADRKRHEYPARILAALKRREAAREQARAQRRPDAARAEGSAK